MRALVSSARGSDGKLVLRLLVAAISVLDKVAPGWGSVGALRGALGLPLAGIAATSFIGCIYCSIGSSWVCCFGTCHWVF